MAQKAAEEAAATNTLRSIDNNDVGQNMAAMTGSELTGDRVSTMWYDEEKNYNYNNAKFGSNTGMKICPYKLYFIRNNSIRKSTKICQRNKKH